MGNVPSTAVSLAAAGTAIRTVGTAVTAPDPVSLRNAAAVMAAGGMAVVAIGAVGGGAAIVAIGAAVAGELAVAAAATIASSAAVAALAIMRASRDGHVRRNIVIEELERRIAEACARDVQEVLQTFDKARVLQVDEGTVKVLEQGQSDTEEVRIAEQAGGEAERARGELVEWERELRTGFRPTIIPTKEQLDQTMKDREYKEGLLHLAVAGIAGSGKSSMVNAARGLEANTKDAARTGVTETTRVITRYPDPHDDRPFVWYDIPGAGTLSIPEAQYFVDQGLYIFDAIIVLFDARFTATDVAILRHCAYWKVPAYIVRSKSKNHIENIAGEMARAARDGEDAEDDDENEDDGKAQFMVPARDKYIEETRASVAQNLQDAELPEQRVYLIDKDTLVRAVKGKKTKNVIDEWELLRDLLKEACRRRVRE
ncbi:hypothetical protein EVJ58_g6833 [Rhodofomes roseus]|uniref:IRG-type G domain-containing protein n=1 Tax=Rhodofomes roseus TaxID=34475 RepID=A0A4Y9Y6R6_9APHY|nr:hypothetical protein EVJ58_g6833 [Rhodofomes roseus]